MTRVTLRIPAQQVEDAEALVEAGEFPNRSEVIRQALRDFLKDYDYDDDQDAAPVWERVRADGGRDE